MKKIIEKNKARIFRYIIALILLFSIFYIMSDYYRQVAINIDREKLQLLANEGASKIDLYLEDQKKKLEILSNISDFIEVAKHSENGLIFKKAEDTIIRLRGKISGISILKNNGVVIVGDIDRPGTDYSHHLYFVEKREDTMFTKYWDPLRLGEYYAIIGPVYDQASRKIIGRIAFDIELNTVGDLLKNLTGKNYESYLIDSDGLLLSASSYIGVEGILVQEVKSDGSVKCLDDLKKYGKDDKDGKVAEHEEEEPSKPYVNYMGDEVIGDHSYVSSVWGCVISEEKVENNKNLKFGDFIKNIIKGELLELL